jgi:hypothetical protein
MDERDSTCSGPEREFLLFGGIFLMAGVYLGFQALSFLFARRD